MQRSELVHEQEGEWLAAAMRGDSEAFGHLVDHYQVPVYNLCYRMLGVAEEAEDAAQETFLRAYRSLRRYDPGRPFSTWLLSIAAHYCIDQVRKQRMRLISLQDLPNEDLPDPAPNPERAVSESEAQSRIRALLKALNPTDRAAIVMYYWYDLSYDEIAEALHLTLSAVKSRLHRARLQLARSFPGQAGIAPTGERRGNESPAF